MRIVCTLLALSLAVPATAVEHATVTVDGAGAPSIAGGSSDFFLDAGHTAGEYPVRIGVSATDDAAGGVLIGSVSELDRGGLYATGGTVRDTTLNSSNTRGIAGGLALSATRAGGFDPPVAGTPADANLSAAYFPFGDGWLGGSVYSSTVNANGTFGALDTLVASAGIGLGSQVENNYLGQTGVSRVSIPGVTDANRQGILVASAASAVGRFATVAPSLDGDSYIVRMIDNDGYFESDPSSDPDTGGEGDAFTTPYSFTFVPVGTPGVTMARVGTMGSSTTFGEQVGVPLVHSGADFTVTSNAATAPGLHRLEIDGFSPADGTLIVTPVGATEDLGGRASDNVVTYTADATGWNILTQDIEADFLYEDPVGTPTPLDGSGQAASGADTFFNFLFIPNDANVTSPGEIQDVSSLTTFNRSRVIGWNSEILALSDDNGNDPGDTAAFVDGGGTQKTSNVRIDLWSNKGDTAVAVDGAHLNIRDGLLLTTVSEGFRDNSANGGFAEYGVAMTTTFDQEWNVSTAAADDVSGSDEHNINFSAAFFGVDSGFQMAINDDIEGSFGDPYDTTFLEVSLPGVNSLTDGILIASPFGNDDNFASAEPKADGSGWEVRVFDNTYDADVDGRVEPDAASWIYLPYDAENLVAGMVDPDGTILSATDGEGVEWTLTRELDSFNFPQYRLSFADSEKNPENGMLLLVSTGDFEGTENRDNSMLYEVDGDDFLIRGLDHVDNSQTELFADYQDTGFMFAYIDFDDPVFLPTVALVGDYNGDGVVDAADYTVWRDNLGGDGSAFAEGSRDPANSGIIGIDDYDAWVANFGATSGDASPVITPEPASLLVALSGFLGFTTVRRRRGMTPRLV